MKWGPRAALAPIALFAVLSAAPAEQGQLSGVANFRDIGGYKTSAGSHLKRHMIYRSGELSGATAEDQQFLQSLHIRYEIDLRTDKERSESPSRWGATAPEVILVSVGMQRNADPAHSLGDHSQLQTQAQALRYMQQATAHLATAGAADIGEVIRRLAQGDEPALIHCSAGKDRTGVTVAVLMTLLQVPRDEVYREYLKSNEAVAQQLKRAKAREHSGSSFAVTGLPQEVLQTLIGTDASYLDAAFGAIDKQYGSFDAYTKTGLKITPEDIQALRAKLLEP